MLGNLVRRLVNGVVLLLAAITFFLVPLGSGAGDKTLFQHLCAVFSTREAHEMTDALGDQGRQVAGEVQRDVIPRVMPSGLLEKGGSALRAPAASTSVLSPLAAPTAPLLRTPPLTNAVARIAAPRASSDASKGRGN